MSRTTKMIAQALRTANRKKTSAYDTTAQVVRVDGDTVWVHIPGGVEETPVRRTIDAEEGDTVQVRVSGGSAFLVGNRTAPPTDDTTAKEAKDTADDAEDKAGKAWDIADEAMDAADDAWDKADEAEETASFALRSANGKNTVYYASSEPEEPEEGFSVGDTWFDTANDCQINEWDGEEWVPFQLGEDAIADLAITNAKIANATIQSAKIAGLDVGKLTGGYIDAGHINTLSLSVGGGRTLGDELDDMSDEIDDVYPYMTYINSTYGVRVYRGDKSNAENQKYYSQMNAGGFDVVADNVTLAHIGYASGAGESGTATAPYYTFGTRASDTSAGDRGNYSVAEGRETTASGYASHAEGYLSTAGGDYSHAEGRETTAGGGWSHAEGQNTTASGYWSHAEGYETTAGGDYSHAQNYYTEAASDYQTVIGMYNKVDTSDKYAFIIGNGYSNNKSNALAVDWNGIARLKGNLFTGCSSDSTGGYEFGRKTGNHVVIGGIHVCWGQVSITCTANTYTETTVTLPYTYSSAPYVFTGFAARNANARSTMGTNGGLALNKIYVGCVSTSARDQTVVWMTIGA